MPGPMIICPSHIDTCFSAIDYDPDKEYKMRQLQRSQMDEFHNEYIYKYSVHVCNKCGLIASYNDKLHIHICRTCDNRVDFSYVEIPYSCKLLFQELTTMNVVPRIMTDH